MRLETEHKRQPDAKTEELLNRYLNKAVAVSRNKDRNDAAAALDDFNFWHEGFEVLRAVPDTSKATIDQMAEDLEKKETSFAKKTKIQYLSDANHPISEKQARQIVEGSFATGVISAMTAVTSSNMVVACAGIAAACMAVPVGKGMKLEEYAELKHRQVALKMLKRLIKDDPEFSYKFDLERKKKDEEKRIRDEQKKLRDAAKPKNQAVEKIKQKLFGKRAGR